MTKLKKLTAFFMTTIILASTNNLSLYAEESLKTNPIYQEDEDNLYQAVEIGENTDAKFIGGTEAIINKNGEEEIREIIDDPLNQHIELQATYDVAYPVDGGNIYFDSSTGAITDCDASVTSAVIPETINGVNVTSIGDFAFYDCSSLTSITIPNSVTSIGNYAFLYCSNLTSIKIPDSVTSIGNYAFNSCSSLTSIKIPDSVTSIGSSAFFGCIGLTNITIPNSVTSIGSSAFSSCSGLTSIIIGSGNTNYTSINGVLFNKNKTQLIVFPAGLEGSYAIPDGVKSIGSFAFSGCSNLTSITIPNSVTEIGYHAFYSCSSLTSITIPNSVTSIGEVAFGSCSRLTSITIPDSVISISHGAFSGCSNLTSITIPDGVKSIGSSAFSGCSNLTSITIPNSVTEIGYHAFSDCSKLTSITIPNSVTAIGYYAFSNCSKLTSIKIPDRIIIIRQSAFSNCSSLTSITIPDSVTSIEASAFYNCSSLTDVYYSGNESEWSAIGIGNYNDCLLNAIIHYNSVIPDESSTETTTEDSSTETTTEDSSTETTTTITTESNTESTTEGDVDFAIKLTPINPTVYIGKNKWLQANTSNKKLTWLSDNCTVAIVEQNGKVTGKSEGTATITCISSDGEYGKSIVTVKEDPTDDYANFKYKFINYHKSFGYSYDDEKEEVTYKIPPERYKQAEVKDKNEVWYGNCVGMSFSSILFFKDKLKEERYKNDVELPCQFEYPNTEDEWAVKLRQMIELFQVSQFRKDIVEHTFNPKEIAEELDKGNPVELLMIGYKKEDSEKKTFGHAVVIYDYTKDGDTYEFNIYDCSAFVTKLTCEKENGKYISAFTDDPSEKDKYEWRANKYCTYKTILNIYRELYNTSNNSTTLFSEELEEKYTYIIRPSEDMTITNSAGQVSTIANGEISGEIENIRLILDGYLATDPKYTIILPSDTYTITGNGDKVIKTTFSNDFMSADIECKASAPITVSADLFDIKAVNEGETEYSINYTAYDNLFDKITLWGNCKGDIRTVLNGSNVSVYGAVTLNANATVSETGISQKAENLSEYDEVNVVCEKDMSGADMLQILTANSVLTEKTVLPERIAVEAPVYNLESGEYTQAQTLKFTKDDNTIIYYTTDGSVPSKDNGLLYTMPIEINTSATIKAVSTKYGFWDSDIVELNYVLPEIRKPNADYDSGNYNNLFYVELSSDDKDAEIYFTLDGSDPYEDGILYTVPLNIMKDTKLLAYTKKNGCISEIAEYDYKITAEYPFYLSNILLTQNDEIISAEKLSDLSSIKIIVSKLAPDIQTGNFEVAFYDKDDNLILTALEKAAMIEDTDTVEIKIDRQVDSAVKIKISAYNDDEQKVPLAEMQELIFKADDNDNKFIYGDVNGNGVVDVSDVGYVYTKAINDSIDLGVDNKLIDVDLNGVIGVEDCSYLYTKAINDSFKMPVEK